MIQCSKQLESCLILIIIITHVHFQSTMAMSTIAKITTNDQIVTKHDDGNPGHYLNDHPTWLVA